METVHIARIPRATQKDFVEKQYLCTRKSKLHKLQQASNKKKNTTK